MTNMKAYKFGCPPLANDFQFFFHRESDLEKFCGFNTSNEFIIF